MGAIDLTSPTAPAGVLISHGFTGSPQSIAPWAEYLHAAGLTVRCPLLPGHGTNWREMNQTRWQDWYQMVTAEWDELRTELGDRPLFAMGLSMGGTLVTRLAQQRGDQLAGLVLVNPSYRTWRKSIALAPLLSRLIGGTKGLGNDIKKPMPPSGEGAYGRTPLKALVSLTELWALTRADLPLVKQPLLVCTSAVDHVVEPENSALLLENVSSTDVTAVPLPNSYHVATLDNDAETIFAESLAFVQRISGAT